MPKSCLTKQHQGCDRYPPYNVNDYKEIVVTKGTARKYKQDKRRHCENPKIPPNEYKFLCHPYYDANNHK